MTKRVFLLMLATAALMLAADKPNFSGVWKLDASKSDFGQRPAPEKMERTVEHAEPSMKVKMLTVSPRGERSTESSYTTDGKPGKAQIMGQDAKVMAKWKGDTLVVTLTADFQGNEVKQEEVWKLSGDGKTLMTETTIDSPQGQMQTKTVFTKQ
jgi:hypothetical protein